MASRGIFLTYETVRQWTLKFPAVRNGTASSSAEAWRQMAFRRSGIDHQGQTFIICGPRRQRAQHSRAELMSPAGGETFLSQTAQGTGLCVVRVDHGQTRKLRRGQSAAHAPRRA
jgi:hypothetical protein